MVFPLLRLKFGGGGGGEVRQEDLLPSYLFNIVLEILTISVRSNKMSRVLWWMEKKLNWNFLQMI